MRTYVYIVIKFEKSFSEKFNFFYLTLNLKTSLTKNLVCLEITLDKTKVCEVKIFI